MDIPERLLIVHCPPFVKLVGVLALGVALGYIPLWLYFLSAGSTAALPMIACFVIWLLVLVSSFYLLKGKIWAYNTFLLVTFSTLVCPILLLLQRAEYFEYCQYRRKQEEREKLLMP